MHAEYVRPMPSVYAATYIDINESYLEQIRKMVNLLMVLSMLLSTLSPIFTPAYATLPSYAFFTDDRAPAAQSLASEALFSARQVAPSAAAPSILTRRASAPAADAVILADGVMLGAAVAPAWFAAPVPKSSAGTVRALGAALTPVWLASQPMDVIAIDAPNASASSELQAAGLGALLTPAWLGANGRQSGEARSWAALAPEAPWWLDPQAATLLADDFAQLEVTADPIGRDLSGDAGLPETAPAMQLGEALAPAWLRTSADSTALLGPASQLQAPLGGPLFFATGACTDQFSLTVASSTPPLVAEGDKTGLYTFTVVITNSHPVSPTGPLTYAIQLPANFFFVGASASAQRSTGGTLTVVQPNTNSAPGVVVPINVLGTPPATTLPAGAVITLTYRL